MDNGPLDQLPLFRNFDEATILHHGNAVAQVSDHGEIVADEDICQPFSLTQIFQQVQDLGLDGHVERRRRFIEQ
ncbi:hypothetical protein ASD52_23080 [Ensifer sp. Root142]|nr:hypothetical protein ASD03_19330 [Ensifer sp. Root127]KQY76891.1 hypothetical protein ASD52_23080 [Ensifer sp. Root142]